MNTQDTRNPNPPQPATATPSTTERQPTKPPGAVWNDHEVDVPDGAIWADDEIEVPGGAVWGDDGWADDATSKSEGEG